MLIGILYTSSENYGLGTGWESQIVTWPAVDMFVKAKQVDGTYAPKVDPLIGKYKANYPLKNDAFMRQLSDGDSYRVSVGFKGIQHFKTKVNSFLLLKSILEAFFVIS